MNRIIGRCRDNARRLPKRTLQPTLEGLEDRVVLYGVSGGQWYNPMLISYSFMPDGTSFGGIPSSLYSTMNAVTTTATWQSVIKKAAAIWQQVAGFNIAQVSDDGTAVGSSGYQQGDSRFGDIRIGAMPEGGGTLALTLLPPPLNGGSDAGDIMFNSSMPWKINNDYDLLTVAIHEFGHALGMDHSAISTADMYAMYTGMKQTLTADDIAGIDSLYGPVPADPTPNTTATTAIDLSWMVDGNSQIAYNAGYVTNISDYEWYKVTVPSSTTGNMTVAMQSTSLSSLAPRLAIYNGSMVGLTQAVAPNTYGTTVSATISGVHPGQVYYIRASGANNGPGSNGAFGLLFNFGSQYQPPIPKFNTQVVSQPDHGQGSLGEATPAPVAHGHGHGHGHVQVRRGHQAAKGDGDQITVKIGHRKVVADALTIGSLHPGSSHGRHGHP